MASNETVAPYHLLQPSFATGEISKEVANRVDLDKYQAALTKAENCLIRPYGPVYKRPGTEYITGCKYNDSKCILQSFSGADNIDYLLEIGVGYIRIFKQGVYKADVVTPYVEATLSKLRFTQSADTMFIASGDYPLKTLVRKSETEWEFGDYEIAKPYFDDSLGDSSIDCKITPSGVDVDQNITLIASEDIFFPGIVGGYVRLKQDVESKTVSGKITSSSFSEEQIAGMFPSDSISASDAQRVSVKITGSWTGSVDVQYSSASESWTTFATYTNNVDANLESVEGATAYRFIANLTSGSSFTAVITTSYLQSAWSGKWITIGSTRIDKKVDALSDSLYVGENWKVITHGTWAGTVKIQFSDDNIVWKDYRTYTGNSDYNVTESGALSEPKYLRYSCNITSGTCTIDLTSLSYLREGYVQVTEYTDAKNVKAIVQSKLGNTNATKQWAFSAWNDAYGYPKTVAFFQDRLCLGGNNKQPYMLWMSRTGDYNNFSVEKADGKVTDDSAVALSFVSRKQFEIRHLVPNTDLLILTKGNEWILSGNEVITPSSATPKMQTTRGCGNVEPIMIGSKTVFVQGRGSVVRDMGYSYETDSYGGVDLTLLNKPVVRGHEIVDATYMQEPNSAIYFVRDDGEIAILTYVIDQKVYAWSRFKTQGTFESICAVAEGDIDVIYVSTYRNGKRYIEMFQDDVESIDPNEYIMLDCASVIYNTTPVNTLSVPQLAGNTVDVLGDGRAFQGVPVDEIGSLTLPTTIKNAVVGLPYSMQLEMPNVEVKGRDGTMQGRFKDVSEVILRLDNSLGGFVGPNSNNLDEIKYDEFQNYDGIELYSGDKKMQVPIGGFNTDGRIVIESSDPYPFNLLAVVRVVSLGG